MKYVVALVTHQGVLDSIATRPLELESAISFARGYGVSGALVPVIVMDGAELPLPNTMEVSTEGSKCVTDEIMDSDRDISSCGCDGVCVGRCHGRHVFTTW